MASGSYTEILKRRGFFCFFCTQFLGAFNDNFYKIIVTLVALDIPASAGGGKHFIPLIGGLFILPFLLFSGYSGYLADVYSKRNVLVAVKCFEIVAMGLGILAFFLDSMEVMLAVVFLMGLHSTIFSPAKYGILPEMLPEQELSRGNGLLEMSTFMAIILGTSLGGTIYEAWKDRLSWIGVVLVGIAVLGTLTSLGITKVPPSGSAQKFVPNPTAEIWQGAHKLYHDRTLWLTVMGISYFWFLGAFLQMVLPLYGKEILGLGETRIGLLWTFAALGIGAGSLMAGRLSGDRIELGLVPVGAIGMGIFSLVLFFATPSFPAAGIALVCMGFFAGFFAVPLNALLQQRAEREAKGRLIATNNVFNTIGVLLAAALLWLFVTPLKLSADFIIMVLGLLTFAMTIYVLRLLPDISARFILWLFTHSLYRIRVVGLDNIPRHGPALLVSNHVSFVDAILIGASMPRFIRFMLHREYYDSRWFNWFFRLMKAIPVVPTSRRGIVESLRRARAELEAGEVVCIFAEGAISRTGHLLPFRRGFEKIVEGSNIPIIPVHLDQVWGSIFSFKEGRFFWKRPRLLPYPVTVSFGAPLPAGASVQEVRQAVQELESEAARHRRRPDDLLHAKFIRVAKRRWSSFCMADTTGAELTWGKTLIGARLMAGSVRRRSAGESMVGVLLPASVGGALANIAVSLAGKVPVNLNFTAGAGALRSALEQCGIKTILTSQSFPIEGRPRGAAGYGFCRRPEKDFHCGSEIFDVAWYALAARALARMAPRQKSKTRRSRHGDFFQRQHGCSQGNHAVSSQHRLEHRRHRASDSIHARGSHHGRTAAVSLVWLHGHALAAAARRLWRGLPSESHRRENNRRDHKKIPSDTAHQHADVLCRLYAPLQRRGVRFVALRHRRRGKTPGTHRQRLQGKVRHRNPRGVWLYRTGAGSVGKHSRRHL